MNKRNHYSADFKVQVVIEVLREEATVNEIAAKYSIHPVMLSRWKQEFLGRASDVFKKGPSEAEKNLKKEQQHVAELERKVGQLTYEVDWLKKNLKKSSNANDRKTLIEFGNKHITVKRQAELLEVNRSSVYRKHPVKTISNEELFIMRLIDGSTQLNRPGAIEPLRPFSGETMAWRSTGNGTPNHERYGHLCNISETESEQTVSLTVYPPIPAAEP